MSNRSSSSKGLVVMILLAFSLCLLGTRVLLAFIFPSTTVPGFVKEFAAALSAKNAFEAKFEEMDEKMETAVSEAVTAVKTADAVTAQVPAVVEEMQSSFALEPVFVFKPVVHTQFTVLGVIRLASMLVAFVLLGMGIYFWSIRKSQNPKHDPQAKLPKD